MKCANCGHEFKGNFCSNCGYSGAQSDEPPVQSTSRKKTFREVSKAEKLVCVLGGIAIIACLIGTWVVLFPGQSQSHASAPPQQSYTPHETAEPTSSPDVEIIPIGLSQLIDTYKENEINANELYLDKVLEITGTVDSIGVDVLGQNYITIGNGSGSFLDTVHCNLDEAQTIAPSSLNKGDIITINGTYVKNTVGVMLDECIITNTY